MYSFRLYYYFVQFFLFLTLTNASLTSNHLVSALGSSSSPSPSSDSSALPIFIFTRADSITGLEGGGAVLAGTLYVQGSTHQLLTLTASATMPEGSYWPGLHGDEVVHLRAQHATMGCLRYKGSTAASVSLEPVDVLSGVIVEVLHANDDDGRELCHGRESCNNVLHPVITVTSASSQPEWHGLTAAGSVSITDTTAIMPIPEGPLEFTRGSAIGDVGKIVERKVRLPFKPMGKFEVRLTVQSVSVKDQSIPFFTRHTTSHDVLDNVSSLIDLETRYGTYFNAYKVTYAAVLDAKVVVNITLEPENSADQRYEDLSQTFEYKRVGIPPDFFQWSRFPLVAASPYCVGAYTVKATSPEEPLLDQVEGEVTNKNGDRVEPQPLVMVRGREAANDSVSHYFYPVKGVIPKECGGNMNNQRVTVYIKLWFTLESTITRITTLPYICASDNDVTTYHHHSGTPEGASTGESNGYYNEAFGIEYMGFSHPPPAGTVMEVTTTLEGTNTANRVNFTPDENGRGISVHPYPRNSITHTSAESLITQSDQTPRYSLLDISEVSADASGRFDGMHYTLTWKDTTLECAPAGTVANWCGFAVRFNPVHNYIPDGDVTINWKVEVETENKFEGDYNFSLVVKDDDKVVPAWEDYGTITVDLPAVGAGEKEYCNNAGMKRGSNRYSESAEIRPFGMATDSLSNIVTKVRSLYTPNMVSYDGRTNPITWNHPKYIQDFQDPMFYDNIQLCLTTRAPSSYHGAKITVPIAQMEHSSYTRDYATCSGQPGVCERDSIGQRWMSNPVKGTYIFNDPTPVEATLNSDVVDKSVINQDKLNDEVVVTITAMVSSGDRPYIAEAYAALEIDFPMDKDRDLLTGRVVIRAPYCISADGTVVARNTTCTNCTSGVPAIRAITRINDNGQNNVFQAVLLSGETLVVPQTSFLVRVTKTMSTTAALHGIRIADNSLQFRVAGECPNNSRAVANECYADPGYYWETPFKPAPCPKGASCKGGKADPVPCKGANYQPLEGEAGCLTCDQGNYTTNPDNEAGNTACEPCEAGYKCSGDGDLNFCPAGTHQPDTGKADCIECNTIDSLEYPYFSSQDRLKCLACGHETISNLHADDAHRCEACLASQLPDYYLYGADISTSQCVELGVVQTDSCFRKVNYAGMNVHEYHTACGILGAETGHTFGGLYKSYGTESAGEHVLAASDVGSSALLYTCAMRMLGPASAIPRIIKAEPVVDEKLNQHLTVRLETPMLIIPPVSVTEGFRDTDYLTAHKDGEEEVAPTVATLWSNFDTRPITAGNTRVPISTGLRETGERLHSPHARTIRNAGVVTMSAYSTPLTASRVVGTYDISPFSENMPTSFSVRLMPLPVQTLLNDTDKLCYPKCPAEEPDCEKTDDFFLQTYNLPEHSTLLATSGVPVPDTLWRLYLAVLESECTLTKVFICDEAGQSCAEADTQPEASAPTEGAYCLYTVEHQFKELAWNKIAVKLDGKYRVNHIMQTAVVPQLRLFATDVGAKSPGEVRVCGNSASMTPTCTWTCDAATHHNPGTHPDVDCGGTGLRWVAWHTTTAADVNGGICTVKCDYDSVSDSASFNVHPLVASLDVRVSGRASVAAAGAVVGSIVARDLETGSVVVQVSSPFMLGAGVLADGVCQLSGGYSERGVLAANRCLVLYVKPLMKVTASMTVKLTVDAGGRPFEQPADVTLLVTNTTVLTSGSTVAGSVVALVLVVVLAVVAVKHKKRQATQNLLKRLNVNASLSAFVHKLKDIMVDPMQVEVTGPVLGRGGFGTVIRGTFGGAPVAIKKLHGHLIEDPMAVESIVSEAVVQADLRHPHLVGFYGCVALGGTLGLVHEFCGDGSLKGACYDHSVAEVPLARRLEWLRQVASALAYLHSRGIAHRDLKAVNVLLADGSASAKLGDLGLARDAQVNAQATGMTMALGTPAWLAPEVIMKDDYDEFAADVYAFGIMAWEVLAGKEPFGDVAVFAIAIKITEENERPPIDAEWPEHVQTMLRECWREASKRPSMREILASFESS